MICLKLESVINCGQLNKFSVKILSAGDTYIEAHIFRISYEFVYV